MEPCSKKIFAAVYSEDERAQLDVDTNIISITFNDVQEKQLSLINSSPISCSFCKAILSNSSVLFESDEYKAFISQREEEKHHENENEEEEKLSEISSFEKIDNNSKIWLCDFCGKPNILSKKLLLNLPTSADVFYGKSLEEKPEENTDIPFKSTFEKDQSIVFCIDNSGSMADTNLRCVKNAVLSQLKEIHAKNPKKKVGLITFESGVIVYGDASHEEISLSTNFSDFELCLNKGIELSDKFLNESLENSMVKLSKKIKEIEVGGCTALGPGLLASMGLLHKGKTGSMIVLCTDGLANCGIGSMDDKKCDEFYEKAGKYAKEKGILISVLTIKGGECKVDKLAILSDLTGGMVSRIKPTHIGKDFKKAFVGEMIGIDAIIRVQLHRALAFKNEGTDKIQIEKEISIKNSIFVKNLGNVTLSTEETFEFRFKSKGDLSAMRLNIADLKEIPIQAQIRYTSLDGVEILRVLTIKLEVSKLEDEPKKIANVKIVAMRAAHDVAKEADLKNFVSAKKKFEKWGMFLDEDLLVKNQENENFQKYYKIVKKKNEEFGKELNKNIARKMKGKDEKIMKEVEDLKEEEKEKLMECCEMNSSEGSSDECQAKIKKFAKKRQDSFECFSDDNSDNDNKGKLLKKKLSGSHSDSSDSDKKEKVLKKKLSCSHSDSSDSDIKKKVLKKKLSDSDSPDDSEIKKKVLKKKLSDSDSPVDSDNMRKVPKRKLSTKDNKKLKGKNDSDNDSSDSDNKGKLKLKGKNDSDSDDSREKEKKAEKSSTQPKKKVMGSLNKRNSSSGSDENVPSKRKTSDCE